MKSGRILKPLTFFVVAATLGFACVEPFDPHVSASQLNILVVEGYINAGPGVTQIQLSKVSPIENQLSLRKSEREATVWIESESGETFQLTEQINGIYESDSLELPTDTRYRLRIERENGKTYSSDYLSVKVTPPIDSLHWEWNDRLDIYANAHDDAGLTFYYTWTYQEDWIIRSPYLAPYYYRGGETIAQRTESQMMKLLDCYGTSRSRDIVIASSKQLVRDAIKHVVINVPASSEKVQDRYRIIVHQRTMTEEEYNYQVLMKKNTEQSGSLFDPMPAQLFGNVRCSSNSNESVIGYIGTYTTQRSELNLYGHDLPLNPVQENCDEIDFEYTYENLVKYLSDTSVYMPYQIYDEDGDPDKPRVIAMTAACLDCRLGGGSSVKPNPRWVW